MRNTNPQECYPKITVALGSEGWRRVSLPQLTPSLLHPSLPTSYPWRSLHSLFGSQG